MHSVLKKRIFHFENLWLDYKGCHDAVVKAWRFAPNTSPLHAFSHFLYRTKNQLISWRVFGISPLNVDIYNTERDISFLENLESSCIPNSLNNRNFRALNNRHTAFLKQNNIHWAQRARMFWLKQGDLNAKFFHNVARIHSHKNRISIVFNNLGNSFTYQNSIEHCFINFFLAISEGLSVIGPSMISESSSSLSQYHL